MKVLLLPTITIATFLLRAAAELPVGGHNIVNHKNALGERDTRVSATNVVQHYIRVPSSSSDKKVTTVIHKKYTTTSSSDTKTSTTSHKSKDSRSTTSKSSKSKSSKNKKKKKKKKCNKNEKCNNKKRNKKNSVKKNAGLITFETHSLESNDGTVYTLASCFATLTALQTPSHYVYVALVKERNFKLGGRWRYYRQDKDVLPLCFFVSRGFLCSSRSFTHPCGHAW